MLVACSQYLLCLNVKVVVQCHSAIFHIIDVGTYFIHTVGGCYCHHIIHSRCGKASVGQVNGFIAAIAQKDVFCRYSLDARHQFLYLLLKWVGVSVEWCIVWILVGV